MKRDSLTVNEYVKILDLIPHPEGGWFRESYRCSGKFPGNAAFPDGRNFSTSIYFLIDEGNFSAFHRIQSDETWHFYEGDPLEVIELDQNGNLTQTVIGSDLKAGHSFQYTVKAGVWFASRVFSKGRFSLVGCTVSPGFDFRDFELASRQTMKQLFPSHSEIITELTRF